MTDYIYLDYAATTPVDPRVLDAMLPYFSEDFGNPSSVHQLGRRAEKAIEQARRDVAEVLNCSPREIIFTSCGSESDNLALRGAALAERERRGARHLIVSPIEHSAVTATLRQLRNHFGFALTEVDVDAAGRVTPDGIARSLRPDTALVSVMYANNEIGTLEPLAEIAALCRERGVLFHTDAVQAASQLEIDVQKLGVDYLALGAHKFYGPKGVGALYARAGSPLLPTQTGGSHEHGLRAGTQNTPYIIGLAEALKITVNERETHNANFIHHRERLIEGILHSIPDSALTGHRTERLPNHASFVFRHVNGNDLLMHLDLAGIAASSGSACKTGDPKPSEVLLALGLTADWALGSLRLTVGRQTTDAHVDRLLEVLPGTVEKLRKFDESEGETIWTTEMYRASLKTPSQADLWKRVGETKRQVREAIGTALSLEFRSEQAYQAYTGLCGEAQMAREDEVLTQELVEMLNAQADKVIQLRRQSK